MHEVCRSKPEGLCSAAHNCFLASAIIVIISLSHAARAQQNQTQPTIDPDEARALKSTFENWKLPAPACTDPDSYIGIKCDCSFNRGSTCHITHLKVFDQPTIGGTIPDALWSLTYLSNLTLYRIGLSGSLSPSIANLTRMQYLSLRINLFSGEIPKELGRLSNLAFLDFGVNNFSGGLPSELGSLTKLEKLYIDSSGVSGPLPSTFASLRKLKTVWASDTELTGPIPDFIGNWTQLTELRLVGNSFDGPIPSSLSTLTSLTDLRIGSVLNGSSSLAFIKDMKNLKILILRNNNISGSIPATIAEYLTQLDLSFNNLDGQIPDYLFNMSSLSFLYLANNSFDGTLPTHKSSSLVNIDLSYNFLSGSFPPWVINGNYSNLNLVGNNFTMINTSNSYLTGLNCLQRNFHCHQKDPVSKSFAIKCGGGTMKSFSGVVYETDSEALSPSTFYVTDSERWAVSNSGYFPDSNNPSYIYTSGSQFTNTLDSPELYRTARLSASSLRYYGLGLYNGNYNVSLQFVELAFTLDQHDPARRVFDIYIQGKVVAKDFNIAKEAGVPLEVVVKNFDALVTDNYMEIHLFWAGKGTCCVPDTHTYGPLISAISATLSSSTSSKKGHTGLVVDIIIGVGAVSLLAALSVIFLVWKRKMRHGDADGELLGMDNAPNTFSYAELKAATEEFNPKNKLGQGGFGQVFKGTLNDGRDIAVKQLSLTSRQGKKQFVAEIALISAVQHRNLVKLYGCCIEADKRLIVYEYLEKKSLDQALFEGSSNLDWPTRYQICLGIARGLAYLHDESRLRIVHRDVKASNILLDSNFTPKISDFGLAKLFNDKTHISTRIAGTIGYLAPEYVMRGLLTEKADVFSYGMVALEVLSGRPNYDPSLRKDKIYLLEWAWNLHERSREIELVDQRLSDFKEDEVKRVVGIALMCTQTSPRMRPAMSRVVSILVGDIEVSSVIVRPDYFTDWNCTYERNDRQNMPLSPTATITASGHPLFMSEIIGDGR